MAQPGLWRSRIPTSSTSSHVRCLPCALSTHSVLVLNIRRLTFELGQFLNGASELGIPLLNDLNAGASTGAVLIPSSMSSKNQSRADSRTAYLDSALSRPNLHLAVGQIVTRLLVGRDNETAPRPTPGFDHLERVSGVEVRDEQS